MEDRTTLITQLGVEKRFDVKKITGVIIIIGINVKIVKIKNG